MTDELTQKLRALPALPGIYKFKDAEGRTLYVGKATSLRSRVRSYFSGRGSDWRGGKTPALVAQIADIDYILTGSPIQALQWESDLIKTERPKFNVMLRDDKHYPYVRITVQEDWPRLEIARRAGKDGARYFGPFTNTQSVRRTMDTLNRLFPYILCTKEITGTDPRPCLYYYINRCVAPLHRRRKQRTVPGLDRPGGAVHGGKNRRRGARAAPGDGGGLGAAGVRARGGVA